MPPTPGQTDKKPMVIPVAVGLVGANGDDMDLGKGQTTRILQMNEGKQTFTFENVPSRPVPSILRGFSAPVKLKTDLTTDDLRFLMVHDSDGFNRWEAGQTYAMRAIGAMLDKAEAGQAFTVPEALIDALSMLLEQAGTPETDKALMARALTLPDLQVIGQFRANRYSPQAIYAVREAVLKAFATQHGATPAGPVSGQHRPQGLFRNDFAARSQRSLKNTLLRILSYRDGAIALAKDQYDRANNMTDRVAALSVLADSSSQERDAAFADYYERFKSYQLVVDKWFSLQATAIRPNTLADVSGLRHHKDFMIRNPNRVRSLYGAFAMNNPVCFHEPNGGGYKFLCDTVIELNKINPQIGARLLTPLRDWRRYEPALSEKMKAELERVAANKDLSPDIYEVVSKSLAG